MCPVSPMVALSGGMKRHTFGSAGDARREKTTISGRHRRLCPANRGGGSIEKASACLVIRQPAGDYATSPGEGGFRNNRADSLARPVPMALCQIPKRNKVGLKWGGLPSALTPGRRLLGCNHGSLPIFIHGRPMVASTRSTLPQLAPRSIVNCAHTVVIYQASPGRDASQQESRRVAAERAELIARRAPARPR